MNYYADVEPDGDRTERPINSVVTKLAEDMRKEPKETRGELSAAYRDKLMVCEQAMGGSEAEVGGGNG